MNSDILKDKVVVIAGACGKIGSNFVEGVIENQGIPILADINKLNLKKEQDIFGLENENIYECDVMDKDSIKELIDHTKSKFKKIDVFVNTTYPPFAEGDHSAESMTLDLFMDGIKKHLGGYFIPSQQFINYFVNQGYGNLINVSSIQGNNNPKFDTYDDAYIDGKKMFSPLEYSCAKSAVNSMTKYFAKYLKGKNIRCNLISPGGIYNNQPETFLKQYKKYCTSKGMLKGKDIKGAFVFLASNMSKYINGQNIVVDDGWSL